MIKKILSINTSFLLVWFFMCLLPGCNKAKSVQIQTLSPVDTLTTDTLNLMETVKPKVQDTLSINAVGDVMFGTNYPDTSEMPPNNGANLLKPFADFLGKADVNFANVEGTFLNSGGTPKGSGNQVYCFRQPVAMAENLKNFGFNVLSVANNHIADFGKRGIESTDSTLAAMKFNYAGFLEKPTASFKIRNIKIGFAAFAPHNGAVDMNDLPSAEAIVKKLKAENDVVIVSFHGGAEGKEAQHVLRKKEIFYKQNRGNVYDFAHKMIDAGADVLLGHGPHVVRAMELYKDKIIAYSLGNFCTYGMFNLKGPNSNAPLLQIWTDEKGNFLKGKIINGKQYAPGGPVLDPDNTAYHRIKELTIQDFPDTNLKFEEGNILKK